MDKTFLEVMLFIWYCITLYFIQTLSTHLIIQHSRQTQKGIIGHFSAILFTLFTSMKESRNVLKCNSGNCSINQSLSKNLAIWKTLEMNHSKDPSFQGIILSTKGYFSILTSLGKFFYIILHIFFLAEKEKKMQAARCLHHLNYVISILEMFLSWFPR